MKHSVHLYLDDEVHNYLVEKLAGTQSLSSYFIQKSGLLPEYREHKRNPVAAVQPVTPQIVEALSCATCTLVQCDPSCALLAHPTY